MKKFTTTMYLLVCVIFASVFTSYADEGSERVIRIKNASREQIMLTYLRATRAKVNVKILDDSGNEVFTEIIRSNNSFEKTYDISHLNRGRYHFEVTDDRGMVSKAFLCDTESIKVRASVEQLAESKYRVLVLGAGSTPVYVTIHDRMGQIVHSDYIKEDQSFTKTYDLSSLDLDGVRFELYSDFKRINRSDF